MSYTVAVDISEAMAGMNAIMRGLNDPQPLLAEIGLWQEKKAEQRIEVEKTTPWGALWEPWKTSTLAKRRRKGNSALGLLWDEGTLLGSFSFALAPGEVDIGTPMQYAPFLEEGTSIMAARPFIPVDGILSPEDVAQLELLARQYMEEL